MSLPVDFADLPASAYPLRMEFIDSSNGEVWHAIDVPGPGAIRIPACSDYGVAHSGVRVIFADGQVHEEP